MRECADERPIKNELASLACLNQSSSSAYPVECIYCEVMARLAHHIQQLKNAPQRGHVMSAQFFRAGGSAPYCTGLLCALWLANTDGAVRFFEQTTFLANSNFIKMQGLK